MAKLKYHCILHEDRAPHCNIAENVGLCLDCYEERNKIGDKAFELKYKVSLYGTSPKKPLVYTIGYQGRNLSMMIEQLKTLYVDCLLDVRTYPYSRYCKDFNRKELEAACLSRNIDYKWCGKVLGGKNGNQFDLWRANLPHIVEIAKKGRPVIMCMEKHYTSCHRKQLGEMLEKEFNCEVKHL
jgi:hypothetical protein